MLVGTLFLAVCDLMAQKSLQDEPERFSLSIKIPLRSNWSDFSTTGIKEEN